MEAVFAYFEGEDPTYGVIEDGCWPNHRPYGTIHRVASSGRVRHAAARCFDWCFAQCQNLRADTHEDNRVMQHVLEQAGFQRCGVIHVADGTRRIAYQKEAAEPPGAAG